MKRMFSLLLTLLLTLTLVSPVAAHAEEDPFDKILPVVTSAFDAKIAPLAPGSDLSQGVKELVTASIGLPWGTRKKDFTTNDQFARQLLNSNLVKEAVTIGSTAAISLLEGTEDTAMNMTGTLKWTKESQTYAYSSDIPIANGTMGESRNTYDNVMVVINGTTNTTLDVAKTEIGVNYTKYKVTFGFSDVFEVRADYTQYADDLPGLPDAMDKLAAAGSLAKDVNWTLNGVSFNVTVPNDCSHNMVNDTCTVCGYSTACPLTGSWTTDFTLSAADLGVNTEDARLRCTLTFSEKSKVTATWEAVSLDAFREFYHTLFVNAYYACGYGAGIESVEEIEKFCMDSTGKSVSDYIYSFLDSFDINALFTPAPASGTYSADKLQSVMYTDLPIMGNPSDKTVANGFSISGNTLNLKAASYGKPDFTFVCTKK